MTPSNAATSFQANGVPHIHDGPGREGISTIFTREKNVTKMLTVGGAHYEYNTISDILYYSHECRSEFFANA